MTDDERDFLFRAYAADPRMRLNHGIRRRLAPLLENERRRLDLAHALLLSVQGSPVIYYGDEIGMGDNIQLGDRDGVRTPMQWSDEANGGFSTGPPDDAPLISPPIDDSVYGFRRINVDAQERNADSPLTWIKKLIRVRRQHQAFGRGSIEFLTCDNRRVLAFARRWQDETILVVANLAASVQPAAVELPYSAAGDSVVDMISDVPFPPVGPGPYTVTLAPHMCYWLQLVTSQAKTLIRFHATGSFGPVGLPRGVGANGS